MRSALLALLLCSCASRPQVRGEYSDPEVIEILSSGFSENDLQLIAKRLATSLAESPHFRDRAQPARVVVARFANRANEGIDLSSLSEKLQVALFRTGKFELIDERARAQIAEEYEYQESGYVDPAKAKGPGGQHAADYIVTGALSSIRQQSGSDRLVYYLMTASAAELQSGVVRWADEKQLRKRLEHPGISVQTSKRLKLAGYATAGTALLVGGALVNEWRERDEQSRLDRQFGACLDDLDPFCNERPTRRAPDKRLLYTGAGLMIGAPILAILTYTLVPDGNPHILQGSLVPTQGGGTFALSGRF